MPSTPSTPGRDSAVARVDGQPIELAEAQQAASDDPMNYLWATEGAFRMLTLAYSLFIHTGAVDHYTRPHLATALIAVQCIWSGVVALALFARPRWRSWLVAGDIVVDPHRPGSASAQVGHVPQDVSDAFTPTRRLRGQIEEVHRRHDGARALAELCELVHLDENLLERFPHQLSGGQLARAALVAALASEPRVLVADEPTAGLDPELASQLLAVLRGIADDAGVAVLVVTHEIGFARDVADTVIFMDDGRIVETGGPAAIFADAEHPRTREFLAAVR